MKFDETFVSGSFKWPRKLIIYFLSLEVAGWMDKY